MRSPNPVLMLVLPYTPQNDPARVVWVAERALQGGVNWVLLRVRELPARLALEVALALRRLTQAHGAWLGVNPYPALAEWVQRTRCTCPKPRRHTRPPPRCGWAGRYTA